MNISPSLYKRLISYAGLATATLATSYRAAEAQIIYTDINPDYSYPDFTSGLYLLDINNDGIADFEFHTKGYNGDGNYGFCDWTSKYVEALGSNEIMNQGQPVDNGFLIGSQQNWNQDAEMVKLYCTYVSYQGGFCDCNYYGYWDDAIGSKFMGLIFVKDNLTYYGWIRLTANAHKFADYAFHNIPNDPIAAGAVGNCDTLEVSVSPSGPVHVCALLDEVKLEAVYPSTTYNVNFRWTKDSIVIPGEDSQTLEVNEPGIYTAIIDGYGCADTSTAVTVTFNSIISPPPDISQYFDTLFSSPQSNYLWFKFNNPIQGATNQSYVVTEDGLYQCGYMDSLNCLSYLSNFYATTCASTEVTINEGSAGAICDLESYNICTTGSPNNSTYHWFLNGSLIPNAPYYCYTAFDPGIYQVVIEGYQSCTDTSEAFELIVNPLPAPVVTLLNDSVIQSSYTTGNQWYFNGNLISGANDQDYPVTEFGIYEVMVTDPNGCTAISPPYYFNPVGISNAARESDFNVFVDRSELKVYFSLLPADSKVMLADSYGKRLFETKIDNSIMVIDVTGLAAGIYFVLIDDGKTIRAKKVFIGT